MSILSPSIETSTVWQKYNASYESNLKFLVVTKSLKEMGKINFNNMLIIMIGYIGANIYKQLKFQCIINIFKIINKVCYIHFAHQVFEIHISVWTSCILIVQ